MGRLVDSRHAWAIRKGITTHRCFRCTRPKSGYINSGSFKPGCPPPISAFKPGRVPWNKGVKHTPETIQKLKAKLKGRKAWNKGLNNGSRTLDKIIRQCSKYKDWRREIFEKDNYTCVFCKIRGKDMQADHHPNTFSEIIFDFKIKSLVEAEQCAEMWNVNNGRTLCYNCHKGTSSYGKNFHGQRINK